MTHDTRIYYSTHCLLLPFLEKIISLIIHDDEGWEVLHLDAPHSLHAPVTARPTTMPMLGHEHTNHNALSTRSWAHKT
jgi:hypothetical protein